MHRAASALGFIVLATVALAGCERPPIDCSPFMYDESRRTCVCPTGTVELDDGSCMLPDGGVIFPPGTDAGARSDAGPPTNDACMLRTYFRDSDGDGDGDAVSSMQACRVPDGYVENDEDCDDECSACYRGATEVCDSLDNDCDRSADEGVLRTFFRDADGDDYGDPAAPTRACDAPEGHVENDDDCNDDCSACHPEGTEVCDVEMLDENCAGGGNEGCACADGLMRACPGGSDVGECSAGMQTCAGGMWGLCEGALGPVVESCNGRDDDCDMTTDGPSAAAACSAPRVSTAACSAGTCIATSCVAGFDDCDDSFANGCEADLASSRLHCGACDASCSWSCAARTCSDPVQIAAGGHHSCALRSDGRVSCWGENGSGQLGDGTAIERTSPSTTVADLTDAAEVVAGAQHSCARRAGGQVVCWGNGSDGRLGNGSTAPSLFPVTVSGLTNATQLAAGSAHTCALRADRTVVCWGAGGSGRLGNGGTASSSSPVTVSGLTDAAEIAAGANFSCARRTTGNVVCWGSNSAGQLGNGGSPATSSTPVAVSSLPDARELSIGALGFHACARRSAGTVACWGSNTRGQLGNGGTGGTTPVLAVDIRDATAIGVGFFHSCAVRTGGTISCWGMNTTGALGNSSTDDSSIPVAVTSMTDASDVSGGTEHSCALTNGQAVWCWGGGTSGQLGDGRSLSSSVPVVAAP